MAAVSGVDEFRLDDDDWFGEGSSFDSGEELAAALHSLGTGRGPAGGSADSVAGRPVGSSLVGERSGAPDPEAPPPSSPAGATSSAANFPRSAAVAGGDARNWTTISAEPSAALPAVRGDQVSGSGWRIRQGVRSLRQAEKALDQLREDAIVVAWAAAAAAVRRARRDR